MQDPIAPGRRRRRRRRSSIGASRLLVALAVLASALATTVIRSSPASAVTFERHPDRIVVTSKRMHDVTVRATLVLTLHQNGDVVFEARDVHNSGRTRKYFTAKVTVKLPEAAFDVSMRLPEYGQIRIAKDSTRSWDRIAYEPRLAQRWDRVLAGSIEASFNFDVTRVQGS